MPPKGPSSNFAAAANVLFQSAQKVGAVLPLDNSGKQYAMQLKRIQNQSKKRGGSLGSVSYRVAEFLATQKPTTTQKPHRQTAYNTVLKKVPLISIPKLNQPIHSDDDAKKESAATARESFFSPKTQINVPTHGVVDATPASSADSPTADQTSDDAAEPQSPSLDDLVLEDKPLFELNLAPKESKISEQHVISQQVHVAEAAPRLTPKVTIPSATPSSLSVGSGTTMFQEKLQTPAATTISVDSWELQREKEIERIKQRQQEAEQRRLQALRDEEHRSLGNEWVKQRTVHVGKSDDGITSALQEVYRSETVIDALRNFELLTQDRASTPSMVSLAAIFICIKIRRLPPIDSAEQTAAFLSVLQGCKVPQPVIAKVKLRLLRGDAFLEVYDSLPPTDSSRYHPAFASSAVALNMRQGKWEHAIELIQSTRSRIQDKTGHLYIRLLRSLPRSVSEDVRKEVISFVTQSIKGSESTSKELRFAMAQAETGATRRSALMQLTSSGDADERVYAELIVRSTPDSTAKILADMEKQGLSIEDPSVLHAILLKVATGEDPMRAFEEIERQEGIIGIRPMHAATAITAARKLGTAEGHKMAMAVMIRGLPFSRHSLGKILPSLYELNMFEEIAQLSDVYSKHIPIVSALPRGVAFINEALRNLNREPLNSVTLKDIQFVPTGSTASSTIASAEVRAAEVDAAALTEKMLSFAKEKNWPSALEMLQSQPKLGTTDASTTLLYNCGLSAAVESPEAVQIIYQLMKEREVTPNATTVNTVLSSLSRSDTWKEAVDFFNDISPNLRDPNTYLVQLSLLGKHDLHQEASAVFDELRRKYSRPSASMFTLAINATAKHDWSTTLSIFQDMLKIHGAAVKDGVINQVVRCLEQHNRHVELAKLEKDIQKRRKKKK